MWINCCRFLLGAVFVFSGFVKAVDPLGTFYKFQDYLRAFGFGSWLPAWVLLLGAVALASVEFCVGVFLCIGMRRQASALLALLLMLVMMPLTLYLAIANPVSDCGCFGDAVVLTNWESFAKNVALFVAAVSVAWGWKRMVRFVSVHFEWMISIYTMLFIGALSVYCLRNLPIFDFRPFKIGVNIPEAMAVPEGAKQTEVETYFTMEKDGRQQDFTSENFPDSTWAFVKARTVVTEQGYVPPIADFYLEDMETGEEMRDSILSRPGYTFLLIAPLLEYAGDSYIDLINEIYDYSVEHGYAFYAATASAGEAIEQWRDRTGAEYPFLRSEETVLKTIIRSNPGLVLLKQGAILNKWSDSCLPDEYVLTDALERIPLGQQKQVSDFRTLCYVLLWFIVPLMLVLGLDILYIKRRNRQVKANPNN